MKCPRCGADTRVLSTRVLSTRGEVRRRECFNLHRFTTEEVQTDELPALRAELETLKNLLQKLQETV